MSSRDSGRPDVRPMNPLINVGFGNMVNTDRIISIMNSDPAPIRRMIQYARDEGRAVDATCGRKTRSVLVMDSGHLILSALTTETLSVRCRGEVTDPDQAEYGEEV